MNIYPFAFIMSPKTQEEITKVGKWGFSDKVREIYCLVHYCDNPPDKKTHLMSCQDLYEKRECAYCKAKAAPGILLAMKLFYKGKWHQDE